MSVITRDVIRTDKAPAAIGPYSQGVVVSGGRTLFTAGQIALDPATGKVVSADVREQTERVMDNLAAVLAAAGMGFENVVKTTIFLLDFGDFAAVNELYGRRFAGSPPARSTVQVARLPLDVRVEIEMIAVG